MKNIYSHSEPPKHRGKRAFYISFATTLTLLILVGGVIIADYQCRSAAFGDTSMPLSISKSGEKTYLNVDTMGIDRHFDVSAGADAWEFLCDFICVPQG